VRVAIYARCSTDKQDTSNQVTQLRDFAARQGWEVSHEFVDDGITGKTAERGELQRMFSAASRHEFDLLLFWALDRLSREGVLPTLQHLERLTAYGIGWRSYTEQFFDSCGPFRDAVISIMATLAKQEAVKRSERTRAGLARVRASGKRLGRPQRVNVSSADVHRMKSEGLSLRAIGRKLAISEGSVRRLAAQTA